MTLTFASAPAEGATVTLAYAAPALNPVKDAAGNPAPAFTGLTVVRGPVVIRIDVGPTPTPNLAKRYDYSLAQLSSNVLGLRGYKLHEMTAHGEGATLTFKVLFDRVVTVTGAPDLKLDLWGETRSARYVGGSGTNTLTFTWGRVSTGDNDFDGIEVKALVLAGASIVDAGNAESMFVANSYGGEHLPDHKVFGGFHEMWIGLPEAEAVEGEAYEFSVKRSIEESRDPESHYVLVGITDSAFPGIPALGRHEGSDNGPGGRTVTFDKMASEGRRANTEDSSLLVIPPVHEDTAGGRTMTIALLTTHFTVRNEHGELAHRIYMPQNLEGVTVPVRVSVSGRRAATVTVSMASTPRLKSISTAPTADTYGRREIIEIEVTASEAVEVIGDPVFRFTIGADPVRAAYDRVNSTATRLLFTYTVQAGDMGPDGISIGDGSTTFELDSNDRIRTVAQRIDIDRSHPAPGTLSGHKVDGSRIADNTAPALVAAPDGATVFTDELTLTYDEALDAGSVPDKGAYEVTATNGGVTTPLPVSAVAVDGSEVTLTLATPALLGETVTLTYTVPAANPLRDRFGNPAGALTNHPVTNETTVLVVLPVVSIEAVHAKAAPLLADAQFRLTASPAPAADLAVTLSIAQAGAYLASTAQTVTIAAGQTSATGTFPIANDDTLASGGLTATVTGGGRIYVPAAAPANAATVQVVVVDPPIVAQWAEDAYEVAEGKDATAALTLKTAAGVPKPRADYKVKVFTTNDSAVAADDFTAVSGEVTVQPGDWTADGAVFAASVPATVETVGDSILEGEERFRLQVSAVTGQAPLGLECPAGLRDLGGAGRCATVITIDDDETLSVTAVTVTSTPAAGTTYLGGETIAFTATFTAPVTVTGMPTFAFMLGEATREAAYARGSDTAELVFAYTVQAGEIDTDGISWSANALALDGGTVRLTTTDPNVEEDAALGHPAQREGLAGHRVDADPPGVESASLDGTRLELVYDEALDAGSVPAAGAYEVTATNGGVTTPLPVSAVAVDGSEVTLTLATPAVFGETVTLTYTVLATNPLRDLFGNPAGALTNHPVTNETTVLPVVSIEAVHAKAAPLLADAQFRLTASAAPAADLAVTLSIAQAGAYLASTAQTVTIAAGQTSATGTFPIANDDTLASGGLTATVTGGGRIYVPAAAPANAATVQVVVVDPPIVAQWAEDAYEVAEGKDATAALTLKTAAGVPKPRADYKVKVFTTNDSAVAADDFTAVSGEVTVQPGDWTADGAVFAASVPATVETVGDSILEGDERFRLQVSAADGQAPLGLECPAGLRDLGGAGRCATVITIGDDETLSVTAVTVTSTPAAGTTYLGGETIAFTATFTAPVTVTGMPTFAFMLGEATREATYSSGSDTAELVFAYTVQAGEIDTDGISWSANALALDGGTVRLTTTDPNVEEDAALGHVKGDAQREHRVDADPPGVESASLTGAVLTLLYDEALDSASRPAGTAYTLTADSVPTSPPVSVAIAGSTVTLTFATAPPDSATVTLAYAAPASNPVKDTAGNAAPGFSGREVLRGPVVMSIDLGAPPTTKPAGRYGYTKAHLSSNVLGLRRYKLHEMTAHGEGATLTFKVPFDRPVTVTGAPTLKLDLWGETRNARYVSGSGTKTLTFTWGPVLTGDNDFDGIEVKALVLAGASIVDAGNAESMFVAESFGGEHFPEHKIFGGFHEMWIELTEAEAVEGEDYTFSVKRKVIRSGDLDEEIYVLVGITDSAFPGTPALGRHEGSDNGPGRRTVTFKPGATEGRRSNTEVPPSVTPPDDEGPTEGRTMTIALHATHVTLENEAGKLVRRIYMPRRSVDGEFEVATVPVLELGTARAGAAPAIVGTPAVSAPQRNGAYAAEERIEAQVAFDTAVIVDETGGSPTLAIALAGRRHDAAYVSGSGSATLRFALEAPAGAEGAAAARAIANGLVLNGATVRDAQGNDAVLEFGENPRIAVARHRGGPRRRRHLGRGRERRGRRHVRGARDGRHRSGDADASRTGRRRHLCGPLRERHGDRHPHLRGYAGGRGGARPDRDRRRRFARAEPGRHREHRRSGCGHRPPGGGTRGLRRARAPEHRGERR